MLCLPRVTNEHCSVSKATFCQNYLAQDKRHLPPVLDQHRVSLHAAMLVMGQVGCHQQPHSRMPSMPSLLPGKHREDGRAIPTNQNVLKHWEPGTLCSLGNSQSQNKTAGKHWGRYTLLLEPHEWAPFCLVPPGACKHQPLDPSHQLLPPSKTAVPEHRQRHPVLTDHFMARACNSNSRP